VILKIFKVRTVLFRQLNSEFVQNFARVALQSAEQRAVAVHDDESKTVVVRQQICNKNS